MIATFHMDTARPGPWRFDSRLPRLDQPFLCGA
jgi:hypothetical protein